jgi:Uma2 family endonuclease
MVLAEAKQAPVTEPLFTSISETKIWTYDDLFEKFGETNQPVELWNGEICMAPAPTPYHQRITFHFARVLSQFIEERSLGEVMLAPVDVILSEHRVVQPDILFIAKENSHIIQDRIRGAPDLVVEVVSTSSWQRDRVEKRALYEQFGVHEYWVVDPDAKTVEVFSFAQDGFHLLGRFVPGQVAHSALLAGFECNVSEILQKG